MMVKSFIISAFLFLQILGNFAKSEVKPPNYDFSLDSFAPFYPNKNFEDVKKQFNIKERFDKNGEISVYRIYISQIRYKFPLFIQVYNGKILDFFARLPSYFSHDLYHQSLINRFGKQDEFIKKENNSVYRWNNQSGNVLTYEGTCTITCFPIYFSVHPKKTNEDIPKYKPLIKQMY